jgi:hypothetical protein
LQEQAGGIMDDETDCDLSIETSDLTDAQYLDALTILLDEWSSVADAGAYDGP